ncbi:MAG: hypothetical protein HYV55_00140 [Parcubacteria group bacterium]|nr:hypothetical protein [Parcubacteria group bacterium]
MELQLEQRAELSAYNSPQEAIRGILGAVVKQTKTQKQAVAHLGNLVGISTRKAVYFLGAYGYKRKRGRPRKEM